MVYGLLANFEPKIRKDFELYQVFMYTFLCQTVLTFPIHILFTKRIDTFWSGDISTIWAQKIRQNS